MNTNNTPHIEKNNLPKFSEMHPELVMPRELVRFPGNAISESYYPCPAPTTPGVCIIEDIGTYSIIFIQKESASYVVPRLNEAVPMPLAYLVYEQAGGVEFQCVFEFGGELFHSLGGIPNPDFGFWETFAENTGTATERLSALGVDLLMRYATSGGDLFVQIFHDETSSGVEHYIGISEGVEISVRRHVTPDGDCWTSTIGGSFHFELLTNSNDLG